MVLRINLPQLTLNVVGITYLLHFEDVMYIYLLILQFLVDLGSKNKMFFSWAEIHQEFSESKLSFQLVMYNANHGLFDLHIAAVLFREFSEALAWSDGGLTLTS